MDMMNSAGGGGGGAVIGYADSVDSSPRSRGGESWDEPFPSSAAKLRLMCSYGGRIVPRPTDRSLCYLGGDTRIVVVERHTTLADLSAKLSRNLLGGHGFTLKYQLPNEDLDSLISVTTDEDLDNMIDEYDRIVASSSAGSGSSSSRSSRLRLFLFPSKPESAPSSIGSLLDDSKSENWFVDALNGAIGMDGLPGDLSGDSSSVNCLLGLEEESLKSRSGISASGAASVGAGQTEHEQRLPRPDSSGKLTRPDIHSMPDSPMIETTSSFGSTSSAPYLSNLPPIRVRPEDRPLEQRMGGLEDHFSQMNITSAAAMAAASATGQRLSDEGGFREQNYPYHQAPLTNPLSASSISPSENPSRKIFSSDEEKVEQVPISKQPQQQQQQPQPPPPQPQLQPPPQPQPELHPPVLQQKPNPLDPSPLEPIARPVYYPDRVSTNSTGVNPIPDTKRDVPISSYVLTSMPPAEQQFRQHPSHVHQFHQQQQQPHQFHQQQPQQQPQQFHQPQQQQQQPQPQQFHQPQQQQQQQQQQQPQPQQFHQPQQQQQQQPQQFHQPQQQPPPPPQPQFIQANPNPQYIHHPATSTVVPYPAYYQMPIQQSQQSNPYDQQQQFPVYYLPVRQNPQPPQPGASTTFSKPIPAKPDLQPNLYRMATMAPPQPNTASTLPTAVSQPQLQPLIHLASDQGHPYTGMGYHVMHHPHPSQQQPAAPVAANYGYEFATDPTGPVFFTQTTSQPGLAPPQYQSVVTSPDAAAAAASTLQSGEVKQTRAA